MIRKKGSQYVILSKTGNKVLGKFYSKKATLKRLRQIEFFKHKKQSPL
jgi:hypothetical protein